MQSHPGVPALNPNTSPAGRGKRDCSGFSLLELLVVVLIVALGVTIVGFAVGNNKPQQLRNDARDFANYTAQVEEEAVLGREAWGVQIYRETEADGGAERIAYRFLHFTANRWIAEAPADVPATARFAENATALLVVDGAEQAIEALAQSKDAKDKAPLPTIWLAPGGEVTPFELQLRFTGDSEGPIVRSDALGRIELDVEQNAKP